LAPPAPDSLGYGFDMKIWAHEGFELESECLNDCAENNSSSSSSESSGMYSVSSSSSSFGYSSSSESSSSGDCEVCCGCGPVKLAVNINSEPGAYDVSDLDSQYSSTSGGGTGLSTTEDYVGGGSHYNNGGNEYCYFHPAAAVADPGEKGCTHSVGLTDFNGCYDLEDNDFDLRVAIYITSSNITAGSTLISKWGHPSGLPDSGRSWVVGYTDQQVSSQLGNYGLYFAFSDDGTNYSQIDWEFGVGVNPEMVEDTWVEFRVARSGSDIKAFADGALMEITSSDFSGGATTATFYPINIPFLYGNDWETVHSAYTNGFLGYMDYFFIQIGGDVCLDPYTPEIAAFSPPNFIQNLECLPSSSSSEQYSNSSLSSSSEGYSVSSESTSSSEGYSVSSESTSSSEGYSVSSLSSLSSESSSSSSGGGGYENTKSFNSDGSNDYLRTDSGFSSWGNQATVSFFMKWDTPNESKPFLKGNDGGNSWLFLRPEGGAGKLRLIIYRSTGDNAIVTTNGGWDDNTWHHVLIRVNTNSTIAQIYIDNVQEATTSASTGNLRDPSSYIQMMETDSSFDEVVITKNYDDPSDFADFSGPSPCPIEPLVTTFIHYKADDVSALTTIPDSSGNGNDAEVFNSTLGSFIITDVPC